MRSIRANQFLRSVRLLVALLQIGAVIALLLGPATAGPLESAIARTLRFEAAERLSELETAFLIELDAFYAARDYKPIWTDVDGVNDRGRELAAVVAGSGTDGLDPQAYRHQEIVSMLAADSPRDLARVEILLSESLAWIAQHLAKGRVDPALVERLNSLYPDGIDPQAVLSASITATDLGSFVASYAPDQEEYRRLKQALVDFRQLAAEGIVWPTLPEGEALKPDMQDARVPLLRESLIAHGDLAVDAPIGTDPLLYDLTVQDAVKHFQIRHGLIDDAVVGKGTLAELNVPITHRIEQIVLNLERRRWMADDRGSSYVFVNLSDFQLKIVRDGRTVFTSAIVVGTEYNQTPVFSDEMEYLEFNPFWNVPPRIARNELLPKIKEDPGYLIANNFELLSGWSGDASVVDPYAVNWGAMSAGDFAYKLRQRPGEGNALGRVKFMFPNQFDVYLHDTPARGLFAREVRAFSHGCMRVGDPLGFAEVVLAGEPGWDRARIDRIVASGERTIVPLAHHLPVHIAYITAFVNKDGSVHFRRDVYGRDRSLAQALFGPET
jgi:murein L,D-transpeptidase YcbB/YkuD